MSDHQYPFGFYDSRWGNPVWVWPQVRHYPNGRLAILLFAFTEDNSWIEPWATATVNLPDAELEPGEVCIKDYAENAGLAELLAQANIIEPRAKRWLRSGFVEIGVHNLTQEFLDFVELHQEKANA